MATAETGRTVVRLKGGDPFVFGRGDSEIESLASHRIPWEVIPGASSATAVLSSAGLPLTRHGQRRSFAVTTARVEGGRVTASFPRADSLVILMGVTVLDQVASRLSADGWPSDTPAAIVERGTLAWERQISGPLGRLGELARRAGVASPALVVVGEAARAIAAIRRRPTILFTGLDACELSDVGKRLALARPGDCPQPGRPEVAAARPRAASRVGPAASRPQRHLFCQPRRRPRLRRAIWPRGVSRRRLVPRQGDRKALAERGVAARVVRPPRRSFSRK